MRAWTYKIIDSRTASHLQVIDKAGRPRSVVTFVGRADAETVVLVDACGRAHEQLPPDPREPGLVRPATRGFTVTAAPGG